MSGWSSFKIFTLLKWENIYEYIIFVIAVFVKVAFFGLRNK